MLTSLKTGKRRFVALFGSVAMMVVLAVAVIGPPMAVGQATRTWVSGVGDDANPCSRTAPCKTFAGAISKTAAGGEINCLDPGGFGGVTITKAITIDCDAGEAGVLVSGTNAIIINAGVNDIIVLRGLDIEGVGTGLNGIRFLAGAALHIEHTRIRDFRATSAGNGNGVAIVNTTPNVEVTIADSEITDNGGAANGAGVLVKPGDGGSVKVTMTNVEMSNNTSGFFADGSTSGAGAINATVRDSASSGNQFHGYGVLTNANPVNLMIDSSVASSNAANGILCNGGGCLVRVGRSDIFNNNIGVQEVGGGQIESFQTNQIRGNTNDNAGVLGNITQQ